MRAAKSFVSAMLAMAAISLVSSSTCYGQGAIVSAGGPVHRGMGGASTAAPTSAISALYWNPATISGLESSELEVGMDTLFTDHTLSSSFGPFSGSTEAEPGTFILPNVGWTHHLKNHPALTFGLGINSIAGFKTNLPGDPSNPVLAPPAVGGLGPISSEATFVNVTPVLSYSVSQSLSLAVGPMITTGQVGIDPFIFASPNADGYPSGRATRYQWGGGVQAGVYYIHDCRWHFGASIKSPSWMETFEFYSADEIGRPRLLEADIDLPMILSLGTSYTGFENWLFAMDARYIDYQNTDGWGDPAEFDATGAVGGLDWSSVWAIALGAQRKLGERFYLRGGYTFNQSPIRDSESFFNTASPLFYEHMLSVGGSYQMNEKLAVSIAYSHFFENSRTGPIVMPGIGAVPGTSVTNEVTADILSLGVIMRL